MEPTNISPYCIGIGRPCRDVLVMLLNAVERGWSFVCVLSDNRDGGGEFDNPEAVGVNVCGVGDSNCETPLSTMLTPIPINAVAMNPATGRKNPPAIKAAPSIIGKEPCITGTNVISSLPSGLVTSVSLINLSPT